MLRGHGHPPRTPLTLPCPPPSLHQRMSCRALSVVDCHAPFITLYSHGDPCMFIYRVFSLSSCLSSSPPPPSFSTCTQRILRSALPRSIRYQYRMGIEESNKLDLTDGDIEFMATRIRQDLDTKHI